jgi:hypothetical protein
MNVRDAKQESIDSLRLVIEKQNLWVQCELK